MSRSRSRRDTIGADAGQLLNMLFGNTSLHEDVALYDMRLPPELLEIFGGPRQGRDGLRRRAQAERRALTCSALKPQGLSAEALGELSFALAMGGLDFIKDDHGLADQAYSPFASTRARLRQSSAQGRRGDRPADRITSRAFPAITARSRSNLAVAREEGVDTVMIAPAIAGASTLQGLVAAHPDFAFFAHPTMAGAARIAPALFARLLRLFGADAAIFPNYGGRFGYSSAVCSEIADGFARPWGDLKSAIPVPAGGMTVQRVSEMLRFYGRDAMLLIGGALAFSAARRSCRRDRAFRARCGRT